jgi:anti-sigma regulatory factor (Ser/Thr protein kinase)
MEPQEAVPARLEIAQRLPVDRRAPMQARRVVDSIGDRAPSKIRESARLVISELVTNSVLHSGMGAGQSIEVRVIVRPGTIRIEVADAGPGFQPTVRLPGPASETGRGLFVVDHVSDRWGTIPNDGIRVWAELDLPARQVA